MKDARDAQGQQEEEGRKGPRTIQIFVKLDGCETFPLELSLSDKVGDVVTRAPSRARGGRQDMYVMS